MLALTLPFRCLRYKLFLFLSRRLSLGFSGPLLCNRKTPEAYSPADHCGCHGADQYEFHTSSDLEHHIARLETGTGEGWLPVWTELQAVIKISTDSVRGLN
jgi:hypothetical protein